MKDQFIDRLPTIGDMRANGYSGVLIRCPPPCGHAGSVVFAKLGLPDDTVLAKIPTLRRLKCEACGRLATEAMPDPGPFGTWGMMPPGGV